MVFIFLQTLCDIQAAKAKTNTLEFVYLFYSWFFVYVTRELCAQGMILYVYVKFVFVQRLWKFRRESETVLKEFAVFELKLGCGCLWLGEWDKKKMADQKCQWLNSTKP